MKKRAFILLVAAAVLLGSCALGETAAETRVYDYASLFSEKEVEILDAAIVAFQQETGYDFAILISSTDHGYDDYQLLCDDFAESKSLGMGMNNTSILCYLDLYGDGYYYISVYGDLAYLMVTDDIYTLVNGALEYFNDGDFPGGFLWTMNMLTMALPNIGTADQAKRVFDFAEILTEAEAAELEAAIAQFRALTGMDFLYLSTYEEMAGNENGDYMGEFFTAHGFGDGENRSGAMVYLELYNGNYFIQNFGDMNNIVSQDGLTAVVENVGGMMGEGAILSAVLEIINEYSAYFQ